MQPPVSAGVPFPSSFDFELSKMKCIGTFIGARNKAIMVRDEFK